MPRVKLPAAYHEVLAEHRARHLRATEGGNLRAMKKLYDAAQGELERKLRKLTRQQRSDTFTAYQSRTLLAQVRHGQALIGRQLAGQLGAMSKDAQVEALRGLEKDIVRLDKAFTGRPLQLPISEASRFQRIVAGRSTSLLEQHATSMKTWGADTVRVIENQMALSVATGESIDEAVGRIVEVSDAQWWRAERVARTETAWAWAATAKDAIDDAREEIPDLQTRWVEYCNDETGEPLDDRVAVDSIAIHGQLATKGLFTMPETAPHPDARGKTEVPHALVGKQWPHPPDRPNDRSLIQAWRPDWGVPAWVYRQGRRAPAPRR